jgi:hypothetical protein
VEVKWARFERALNVVDVETDPDIDAIRNYPAFQHALDRLRESVQPVVTSTTPTLAPK